LTDKILIRTITIVYFAVKKNLNRVYTVKMA